MASKDVPNVYAYHGRRLLEVYQGLHKRYFERKEDPDPTKYPVIPASTQLPVCVIGAGMAGLYTAMILESLEIPYKIIEAGTPGRFGRMFTYNFGSGGPYDYFDVGAMRFPDTSFMARLFDLIEKRNLQNIKLIPYTQSNPNTWLFFNNARLQSGADSVSPDPFNVESSLSDKALATPQAVAKKVREVLQPFRDLFRPPPPGEEQRSIEDSMTILFDQTNNYSMRTYMHLVIGMAPSDVRWCETLDKSTGWYERGLAETVIEDLAFNWPTTPLPGPENPVEDPNAGWWCFDGGSSTLPRAMFASLSKESRTRADFNTSVTALARDGENMRVTTSTDGYLEQNDYSAVICTMPLPRLKLVDLSGTGINESYSQWSAIRELQYGSAVKIGMKFSTAWWEDALSIHGGSSFTDLPLRTIVYPSYPENATEETRSNVIIASYCWTQDADQIGALINSDGSVKPELFNLIFRDLAAVHGLEVDFIRQYYQGEYFAWDWQHNPLTMGAYAFFGPGVYDKGGVYSQITQPASGGKLFFAGEAASSAHPWVTGALGSAWRAVNQYLAIHYPDPDVPFWRDTDVHNPIREKFWNLWGTSEYMDEQENEELVKKTNKLEKNQLKLACYKIDDEE